MASPWDRRMLDQLWTATERFIQSVPGATESVIAAHEELCEILPGVERLAPDGPA